MRHLLCTFLLACLISGQVSAAHAMNCNEAFGPILANDSPKKMYFENILKKGPQATLEDLMVLWYPNRQGDPRADDTDWDHVDAIKLDTVYHWGSITAGLMQKSMADGQTWTGKPVPGMLDTVVSAIGSWGYGMIPVRIKLKPRILKNDYSTFIVSPKGEQIINNASDIESWSFGTPEHYDEIVRDYLRFKSAKPWVGYIVTSFAAGTTRDQLFFTGSLDGHTFSEPNLKVEMLNMVQTILQGNGRIYYSQGTCRNRQLEFETRVPTYINPFQAP